MDHKNRSRFPGEGGITYSQFMHGLKLGGVELDRKVLADMAVQDAQGFGKLIDIAKEQLAAA
ncbi:MAG: hypothetical protein Ct9H300mP11_11900 [Chloroflexota bacterium]|nr:MAG: hypothetical protein Ct9H300mP11_11900 [Chloroflexota bacterium]